MALLITKENIKKTNKKEKFDFKSFTNVIVFLIFLFLIYFVIEMAGVKYHLGTHADIIILLLALIGTYFYNKYKFIKGIHIGRDIKKLKEDECDDEITSCLSKLKDSYYILRNVSLKGRHGIINISFAVICEDGLIILREEKGTGLIKGSLRDEFLLNIKNNKENKIVNPFIKVCSRLEDINEVLLERDHSVKLYSALLYKKEMQIELELDESNKAFNNCEDLVTWIKSLKDNRDNKIKFDEVIEIVEELV